MDKIDGMSMDITNANIEKIKELFPNVVTEGKIDFDMLRTILGDEVDASKEKYQFTWNGKADSIKIAQAPSAATLRPCKEKSKDWDTTENLYIEGDNLEVLKQLQKTYYGKIKMIYIDPPYNTGNDFVYKDDFKDSIENYKEQTNQMQKSNPETSGRFHSAWLNMMYPRLLLSRNFLTEDGVVFISIDDGEVNNLREICNEIFGEHNFVASFVWKSRQNKDNRNITGVSVDHEYILCYSKSAGVRVIKGSERKTEQYSNPDNDPRGPWASGNMAGILPEDQRPNCHYDLINPKTGINYGRPKMGWRYDKATMAKLISEDRILWPNSPNGRPRRKTFLSEVSEILPGFSSIIEDDVFTITATKELDALLKGRYFSFPKPVALINRFIDQGTDKDSIVLDFFSGSATSAHAVMSSNNKDGGKRKYIMVQLPELTEEKSAPYKAGYNTICEIAEERIRRAGEAIKTERAKNNHKSEGNDFVLDIGFKVFKLDSTNINPWDNTKALDEQTLFDTASVFKSDRSKEDILYEIMLKYGVFDQPTSEVNVNGKTMYRVGRRHMIVCLEDEINDKDIETICELEPRAVVFKEDGFKDDNAKINAEYNLKKAGVEDVKCI